MVISAGIRYMLLASLCFTVMQICIKFLPEIPVVELVFFRSLVSLGLSFGMLRAQKVKPFGVHRKYLVLRGVFGVSALMLFFTTVKYLPLAIAVVLQYVSPVFTAILGIYIVGERVRPVQWFFFAVALAGVFVVRGPDLSAEETSIPWPYFLAGLGSSLFAGLAYNMIRKIKTREHPVVVIFYFPLVAVPVTGLLMLSGGAIGAVFPDWKGLELLGWRTPQGMEWALLLGMGLATQAAQFCMTKAYQLESLTNVAIVRYLGLIYALLAGWYIFDEELPTHAFWGMALLAGGVILNLLYLRWLQKRKKT